MYKDENGIVYKLGEKKGDNPCLVDFLHPGSVLIVVTLERRHVVDVQIVDLGNIRSIDVLGNIRSIDVLVQTKTHLHHAVDATSVHLVTIKSKTGQEGKISYIKKF